MQTSNSVNGCPIFSFYKSALKDFPSFLFISTFLKNNYKPVNLLLLLKVFTTSLAPSSCKWLLFKLRVRFLNSLNLERAFAILIAPLYLNSFEQRLKETLLKFSSYLRDKASSVKTTSLSPVYPKSTSSSRSPFKFFKP